MAWASLPVLAGDSTVIDNFCFYIFTIFLSGRPLCECFKNSCPFNHRPSRLPQQGGHNQVWGQGLLQEDPFLQHLHHWVWCKCPLPWCQSQLPIPKVPRAQLMLMLISLFSRSCCLTIFEGSRRFSITMQRMECSATKLQLWTQTQLIRPRGSTPYLTR